MNGVQIGVVFRLELLSALLKIVDLGLMVKHPLLTMMALLLESWDTLLQPSVTHVREVLGPLEVGHGDAAGIHEDVGHHQHAALDQLGLGAWRRRSVGRLGQHLATDFLRVVLRDLILERRRNQDVALDLETVAGLGQLL